MIHAALSGHHCTSVKEVSAMIGCLFGKNGQFDLGTTGSETLEKVYSAPFELRILYAKQYFIDVVKLQVFSLLSLE